MQRSRATNPGYTHCPCVVAAFLIAGVATNLEPEKTVKWVQVSFGFELAPTPRPKVREVARRNYRCAVRPLAELREPVTISSLVVSFPVQSGHECFKTRVPDVVSLQVVKRLA